MTTSSLRASLTLAKAVLVSFLAVLASTAALAASAVHATSTPPPAAPAVARLAATAAALDWPGGPCDPGAEARTC